MARHGRGFKRFAVIATAAALVLTGCVPTAEPEPTPTVAQTPTATPTPTAAPPPTPEPWVDPLPDGAVTALLLGTDSRTPGAFDGNADVMMLAQISADRQTLALVSITRDSWVNLPGRGFAKINAAFSYGGTELARQAVSGMFGGLEIDYVVQTDFTGFVNIADSLGGFTVQNQHASQMGTETGNLAVYPAGPVTITNHDALAYVRQRKELPEGDLDRTQRARESIIGMLDRVDQIAADPAQLTALMGAIAGNVRLTGELSVDDMVALATISQGLERTDIVSLMAPLDGYAMQNGQWVNVIDAAQTAALGAALQAGDVLPYVATYGTEYALP
ncbi:LCP family protein [Agrococcus beijingensis]|uniref:LCP family protein n=1 Tax=Agrococcus beijingensis TaxID=3068634 RepID=UPI002741DBF4|nr:LCP family protein [Agrococcus sp. REN33]